jgi:cell division protein FtsL
MIRLRTLFWLLLVSATGFAMFGVKYQVQALEDELGRINRAAAAEEHEIRVLDAEWAYLTRPQTLESMNRQFFSLVPTSTRQLRTTVADIPMRPPPPAPPQPVEAAAMVASAEPAPVPNAAPSPAEEPSAAVTEPAKPAAEPPQAKSALRAMPALLEKPTANAQLAKAVPAKTAARSSPTHRAKSLDDLISQIMASR